MSSVTKNGKIHSCWNFNLLCYIVVLTKSSGPKRSCVYHADFRRFLCVSHRSSLGEGWGLRLRWASISHSCGQICPQICGQSSRQAVRQRTSKGRECKGYIPVVFPSWFIVLYIYIYIRFVLLISLVKLITAVINCLHWSFCPCHWRQILRPEQKCHYLLLPSHVWFSK